MMNDDACYNSFLEKILKSSSYVITFLVFVIVLFIYLKVTGYFDF